MISQRVLEAVDKERTSKKYAEDYYQDESDIGALFEFDMRVIDGIITKPGRLFDSMMGRGRHVMHFARKGFRVVGNDYNPYMVKLTEKACRKEKLDVRLYNLDATDLKPLKRDVFDYVICLANSLGCVPGSTNRQKVLQEFSRILKPGGLCVFHAFNRFGLLFNREDLPWVFKTYLNRDKDLEIGDYIYHHSEDLGMTYNHIYSLSEARAMTENAGLQITDIRFINRKGDGFCHGLAKSLRSGSFMIIAKKP